MFHYFMTIYRIILKIICLEALLIYFARQFIVQQEKIRLLRYPGGKQRKLHLIMEFLPDRKKISGYFIEPFAGGAAVFFGLNPKKAILSDINPELIDLYRGLRRNPEKVWKIFSSLPSTKKAYYKIRNSKDWPKDITSKAARTLYLSRTCFKGMWRHNSEGQFNVGYGGQDRRWVITKKTLIEVSKRLRKSLLKKSDFEEVIENSTSDDFLFLDPPYKPGERELLHDHYTCSKFTYSDHKRLSQVLRRASSRGVKWCMTICSHPDILDLYKNYTNLSIPKGQKDKTNKSISDSGEVLIINN